jgi:hypothetical protein
MTRRRGLAFAAIAAVTLLVSHDAIFLVQLGPGEELARTLRSAGHDYWALASVAIAVAAILVGFVVVRRIRRLTRDAARLRAPAMPSTGLGRRTLRTWAWLIVVVAIGFVLQENAEHLVVHAHPIGFGALVGPEYPLALPIIAFLTGIAAIAVELIAGVERSLLEAIAAVLASHPRPGPHLRRPGRLVAHRSSVLSRMGASRAPPLVAFA